MDDARSTDLEDTFDSFSKTITLAKRVHNTSRQPFGPCTEEGHFLNENTIVRVHAAAEDVRNAIRKVTCGSKNDPDWYSSDSEDAVCYVVLTVYRHSIIHKAGRMVGSLVNHKELSRWQHRYQALCGRMGVPAHEPGEQLILAAQPVIQTLMDGLERFVAAEISTLL